MAEVAALEESLKKGEAEAARLDEELTHRLEVLPNLPFDDVPDGTDEHGNVEIRRHRQPAQLQLRAQGPRRAGRGDRRDGLRPGGEDLGLALRVPEGAIWPGWSARSAQFMLDLHTGEGGYTEVNPPLLVRDNAAYGVGQLPKFAEDMFHTDNGYWLIPTAEVPLTNLVNDTVLDEKELPLRFTAFTPCFRSEAGAAGKDTRGMIRLHQFPKVELVSITTPEQSDGRARAHDRLRRGGAEAPRPRLPHHGAVRRRHGPRPRARPTTSRSGCPARTPIARFRAARTAATSRPAAWTRATGPKEGKGTRFLHTLNGSASRSAAPWSRCWRTIRTRTAR